MNPDLEYDLAKYRRFLDADFTLEGGEDESDANIHWAQAKKTAFTLFNVLMDQDLKELVYVLDHFPAYVPLVCAHFRYSYNYNENEADLSAASRLLEVGEPYHTPQFVRNLMFKLPKVNLMEMDDLKKLLDRLEAERNRLHPIILAHYRREVVRWCDARGLHKLQRITLEKRLEKIAPDDGTELPELPGIEIPYS